VNPRKRGIINGEYNVRGFERKGVKIPAGEKNGRQLSVKNQPRSKKEGKSYDFAVTEGEPGMIGGRNESVRQT